MSTLGQIIGYIGLAAAFSMMFLGPAVMIVRHRRWLKRRRSHGGYVTEDLIRRCRFYDDQADPWELIP